MKLLLTSAGITNDSIKKALEELAVRPLSELNIAFIPTAANVEEGGKEWLINNLSEFKNLNFYHIDIIDISALPKENWERRLKKADILVFGGGNTFYLRDWVEKSGLKALLPELLEDKIYIGISAGSVLTYKKIDLSDSERFYYEEIDREQNDKGLGLIDFYLMPHFNSSEFPELKTENIKKLAENYPDPIYAIDDQTAIKVDGDKIEVVSEGEWEKF